MLVSENTLTTNGELGIERVLNLPPGGKVLKMGRARSFFTRYILIVMCLKGKVIVATPDVRGHLCRVLG